MRNAAVTRKTAETEIRVAVNLDGTGKAKLATGVPFLDHMLDQVARHGLIDLDIEAKGDLHIDAHHTVEDIGITLGQAVAKAIGDKKGIRRFGHAYVPLDEALSRVVIDFSGRPGPRVPRRVHARAIGEFDVDLVHEFFQGFVNHAQVTLHVDNLRGRNAHHQAETVFKAFARALRMAVEPDPRAARRRAFDQGHAVGGSRFHGVFAVPARMMHIAVVDYGMGNLRSVSKAIEHVAAGRPVLVTSDAADIDEAERVVFPGQGAMPDCMRELERAGLREAVVRAAAAKPLLGICIGVQMLFDWSAEGDTPGLGTFRGRVRPVPARPPARRAGRTAQGPAHGLEPGAPDRGARAVARHRRRRALLLRATATSSSPEENDLESARARVRAPLYLRGGAG